MKTMIRTMGALPLLLLSFGSAAQSHALSVEDTQSHASAQHLQGWQGLVWQASGNELTVTNTGGEAIHLERDIKLMPDEMPLTLIKTTLQPGETLPVYGACPEHLPLQKEVVITLAGENAQSGSSHTLPINH